jgi:hypothetical protein
MRGNPETIRLSPQFTDCRMRAFPNLCRGVTAEQRAQLYQRSVELELEQCSARRRRPEARAVPAIKHQRPHPDFG